MVDVVELAQEKLRNASDQMLWAALEKAITADKRRVVQWIRAEIVRRGLEGLPK